MITIQFTPWAPFHARKNTVEIHRWLAAIGDTAIEIWKSSMPQGSPGHHSAGGAWPFVQSGRMRGTINKEVSDTELTIGSAAIAPHGFDYSFALRYGTGTIAIKGPRKMSEHALREGIAARPALGRWVEWSRL